MINQEILTGDWHQLKGKIKENWGKLTDNDLDQISGKTEAAIGKIAERYGITKFEAKQELNKFMDNLSDEAQSTLKHYADKISDVAENVSEKTQEIAQRGKDYAKKNPLVAAGVILTVGVLIGLLCARS